MKFSIKDFLSKRDQIRRKLRIWSHLLKKCLMENFIFCAVWKHLRLHSAYYQSEKQPLEVFLKKCVLKNFIKFPFFLGKGWVQVSNYNSNLKLKVIFPTPEITPNLPQIIGTMSGNTLQLNLPLTPGMFFPEIRRCRN